MQVLMQSRYTPYFKPLKISIPESSTMIAIDPRIQPRFDYMPYYHHFGNYYNQFSVQPSLSVVKVNNQPNKIDELKFSINSILGLNKTKSNDSGIVYNNENNLPESGRLSLDASNYCLAPNNSSPTSSSSNYSPTFDNERTTEPDTSRYNSTPENSCDSANSCNKRKSPPSDIGAERSKRARTIFSTDQMTRLEQEFNRTQYMVGQERTYLAQVLNLTESQVKIWFQNRRIKWRKQNIENQKLKFNHSKDLEDKTIKVSDSSDSYLTDHDRQI